MTIGHEEPTRFPRVKYGRTYHLPNSPGVQSDDKVASLYSLCQDADFGRTFVYQTEKMDGENTTFYRDGFHARSLDSHNKHESRSFIAAYWAGFCSKIPPNVRIVGENLYAKHSIHYKDLSSMFQVFSIQEINLVNKLSSNLLYLKTYSFKEIQEFCEDIGMKTVPLIKKYPPFLEKTPQRRSAPAAILSLFEDSWKDYSSKLERESEGFTLSWDIPLQVKIVDLDLAEEISKLNATTANVVKYVRKNHVQTNSHWFSQPVVRNELAK